MEFVKIGDKYLIKNSNGRIISESDKLQIENNELILKDIEGCECQAETTKKIAKNKKRLKELEKLKAATSKENEVETNDSNKKTDKSV